MNLEASGLSARAGDRRLLEGVSLQLAAGRVHAVLGPNGAGKSTLLRLLSGDLRAEAGSVRYAGRALGDYDARALARIRAVLPQRDELAFALAAIDVVRLGRLPWNDAPAQEKALAEKALDRTGAAHLATHRYTTLSGGERARVQLARVLVQLWDGPGPRVLLLDEPTAHLDLAHQHHCLRAVRRFADAGASVLVVLHDPNLALAYADEATLLCCGEPIAQGTSQEVLDAERLSRSYGVPIERVGGDRPWLRVANERLGPREG